MVLKKEEIEWLNSFYEKVEGKLAKTSLEIGVKFPYTTKEGKYEEFTRRGDIGTWTSGFWVGIMWKAYNASGKKQYLDIVEECTKVLSWVLDNSERVTHDIGFLILLSAVAGFRLTENEEFKKFGIHGAAYLAGRFNPTTKNIIANNYSGNMVIIDTMMNIPLLFWARAVTGLTSYSDIAVLHAERTMQTHIREDGSVNHQVSFDGKTGEVIKVTRGQGYSEDSSWSRGQAWALYGFTLV